MTITDAAKQLHVARSTAFRWLHRFLALPQTAQHHQLIGIAKADETFFLRSNKGRRGLMRKSRERGGKARQRGLSKEQIPVLLTRDRSGSTADFILQADSEANVVACLKPILAADAHGHCTRLVVTGPGPSQPFS